MAASVRESLVIAIFSYVGGIALIFGAGRVLQGTRASSALAERYRSLNRSSHNVILGCAQIPISTRHDPFPVGAQYHGIYSHGSE